MGKSNLLPVSFASSCADDSILGAYDTLVVNAGAHRRRGGIKAYGEMMRNASTSLAASMERLHGDEAIMIVRNTVPGHGKSYERYIARFNTDLVLGIHTLSRSLLLVENILVEGLKAY